MVLPMITFHYIRVNFSRGCWSWGNNRHVVDCLWRRPHGRELQVTCRTRGDSQPIASKKWTFSPTSTRKWILPTTWESLEVNSSSLNPPDEDVAQPMGLITSLWDYLDYILVRSLWKDPAKPCWTPSSESCETVNVCCLKLLNLW